MSVKTWINELQQHGDTSCVIVVIGNKCDLISERQVEKAGQYFATVDQLIDKFKVVLVVNPMISLVSSGEHFPREFQLKLFINLSYLVG